MNALQFILSVALLWASCFAASVPVHRKLDIIPCNEAELGVPCTKGEPKRIVRVEHGTLTVPVVDRQEDVNFAVNRSSSGFSRVTGVGVRVQIGVSASLSYNISVNALTSESISSLNQSFVSLLNDTELEIYDRLVAEYNNGLFVPFLALLGINLNGSTTEESQRTASRFISRYNDLSTVAEELLESTEEATVSVAGSLIATGVSRIPVEGFVFIRTARVFFNDGSSRLVVTSDPNETEAATLEGTVLPSRDRNLFTGSPDDVPSSLFR